MFHHTQQNSKNHPNKNIVEMILTLTFCVASVLSQILSPVAANPSQTGNCISAKYSFQQRRIVDISQQQQQPFINVSIADFTVDYGPNQLSFDPVNGGVSLHVVKGTPSQGTRYFQRHPQLPAYFLLFTDWLFALDFQQLGTCSTAESR